MEEIPIEEEANSSDDSNSTDELSNSKGKASYETEEEMRMAAEPGGE